ncbi:hypothetical protein [Methylopila turkensis]|uniref:DsrE/DsrF-like family protein n=1 Tax=Methylopila turkensis TaxID=1437816 RepID=A0A9W6JRL4_9HYPH|nr:hypothetical protein [Methylopila turkensis]GLK81074.1 hypothetical protein GCM10008174_28150 [Methylopila turkensis]
MRLRAAVLASLAIAGLWSPGANAAPGDKQFVGIENHDPRSFQRALRAGADFVRGGRGRQFQIILSGRGAILVIPGTSTVQRDMQTLRAPGLKVVACRETMDALSRANRRRVPVIPGATVEKCEGLRNRLTVGGWQYAPGL